MNSQKGPQPDTQSRFMIVRLLRRWPALSMIEFFLLGVLGVCGLLFLFWFWSRVVMEFFLHWWGNDISRLQYAGQFGDLFGSLNAAIGICTIAGLTYTILLQRKEIARAEAEARRSHAEAHSAKVTEVVFQLIALLRELAHAIDAGSNGKGRAAWLFAVKEIVKRVDAGEKASAAVHAVLTGELWTTFHCYFNTLTRTYEYIESHGESEKELFASLVKVQLAPELITFVFCACTLADDEHRGSLLRLRLFHDLNTDVDLYRVVAREWPDLNVDAPKGAK